jgi:hypothetical protein
MKNYLVQSLYKINATVAKPGEEIPPSMNGDVYSFYKQLQQISYNSFRHFLQGEWEYVLIEKEVDNVLDVFRNNFQSIYDLRQAGPCNILYCGLDSQMIRPTEVFGKYDQFRMFNHTDPKRNHHFENNFNCDIRYYPSTLDEKWWDFTMEWKEKIKIWEDEQNVYNWILWGQGVTVDQVLDPKMAFQAHMMAGPDHNADAASQWNGLNINESHMIHWHSSRGPENRIATMGEVNQRTGVPQ